MADIVTRWCGRGKNQYSPELIDQLTNYKDDLLPMAREKNNVIPSKLLINHFTKGVTRPNLLLGSWKIEYLTGETLFGNLRVYIIYNSHVNSKNNRILDFTNRYTFMRVKDWLINIMKNSDVYTDLFLETDYPNVSKDEYIEDKFVSDMIENMRNCILSNKDCPSDTSRIHNIDISYIDSELKSKLYNLVNYSNEGLTKESLNSIIDLAVNIFSSDKVKKDLSGFTSCIREDIVIYFRNRLKQCILNMDKLPIDEYKNNLHLCIGGIFMDIYLMGKLFNKIENTNSRHVPDCIHNAIIYTSTYHAEVYSNLLKRCDFKVEYSTESPGGMFDNFVDIFHLQYPLFRNYV